MPIPWNKFLIVLFFLVVNVSFSQEKNPTVYPYGGVPDSIRFVSWRMARIPLNFKKADFVKVKFEDLVDLRGARFGDLADFGGVDFHCPLDLSWAQFFGQANFEWTQFDSLAGYTSLRRPSEFYDLAKFIGARFHSKANFGDAQFNNLADFQSAKFDKGVNFKGAKFDALANFEYVKFDSFADFEMAKFDSLANFVWAKFKDKANFNSAVFNTEIDFRNASLDSLVDFSLANIKDTVWIGILNSSEVQRYDFMRTNLNAKSARIVLWGSVDLKIQAEKFKFITIWNGLDYFSKKNIISALKDISFKEDKYKKERFEIDYLFEKSTMYQVRSTEYAKNKWHRFQLWPKWIKNFFYYITMGLGYRPFRLAWWVLGFIIGFSILYFFKMRDSINGYILKKFEMKESSGTKRKKDINEVSNISHTESLMNCFYFSSTLLFSFRLKGEILTFFKLKEKRIIVGEYLLGLLIYIAFLTLAKSGSILHNLKSLFVG